MDFLHYLDVLIGYALAMALLSTAIAASAAAWTGLVRTRSRHVHGALTTAFENLGTMTPEVAAELATSVMKDRVVKASHAGWSITKLPGLRSAVDFFRSYFPETLQREELALLLLRKAAAGTPLGQKKVDVAKALGLEVATAQAQLHNVQRALLDEEAAEPEYPASVWKTRALQQHAAELAAPLFTHFDNLMDRVEDNVQFTGKVASAFFAAAFLYLSPVDSVDILRRLSSDPALRQQAVSLAKGIAETPAQEEKKLQAMQAKLKEVEQQLGDAGLFGSVQPQWPAYLRWPTAENLCPLELGKLPWPDFRPGVVLTWLMVSLGAPFWLATLSKLVGLRTVLEERTEQQRNFRAAHQPRREASPEKKP